MRNQKAFTLIEVLAALALLAIALAGIVQGQSGSVKTVVRSENMIQAAYLAQEKMNEVELQLKYTNFDAFKEEESGEFANPKFSKYQWTYRLERVDVGCFLPTGQADAREAGGIFAIAQDIFERAIRKISIEVTWNEGGRELSTELVQLFVRFEEMSGGLR